MKQFIEVFHRIGRENVSKVFSLGMGLLQLFCSLVFGGAVSIFIRDLSMLKFSGVLFGAVLVGSVFAAIVWRRHEIDPSQGRSAHAFDTEALNPMCKRSALIGNIWTSVGWAFTAISMSYVVEQPNLIDAMPYIMLASLGAVLGLLMMLFYDGPPAANPLPEADDDGGRRSWFFPSLQQKLEDGWLNQAVSSRYFCTVASAAMGVVAAFNAAFVWYPDSRNLWVVLGLACSFFAVVIIIAETNHESKYQGSDGISKWSALKRSVAVIPLSGLGCQCTIWYFGAMRLESDSSYMICLYTTGVVLVCMALFMGLLFFYPLLVRRRKAG